MLPLRKSTRKFISFLKPIAIASALVLAGVITTFYLTPPAFGSASSQAVAPNSSTRQGMMDSSDSTTSTMPMSGMSMAEMGAMMDEMMAQMSSMMASTSMTGTALMTGTTSTTDAVSMPMPGMMSMAEMGQMMQMMGVMHQKMGQMQMMMGAMMSGDMMSSGMMGEGMGNVTLEAEEASPDATATVEPSATEVVSESIESSEPETAISDAGHPSTVLAATPQSATAGAITVDATPLTTDELLDVAFAVTLETHSVELNFDLAGRAILAIGEFSFPATSWSPDAPSGHHVEGTLRFTIDHPAHAALAEADVVTLELQDIDGQLVKLSFAVE